MSDQFDMASDIEEQHRMAAIRAVRDKPDATPPTGHCHYCNDAVGAGLRFCDVECRDDYDAQLLTKRCR